MSRSCLETDCCVDVVELGRSIRTFVEVDFCNYQLRVGIDRLKFNRTLAGFNWGEIDKFDLYGIFVVEYVLRFLLITMYNLVTLEFKINLLCPKEK